MGVQGRDTLSKGMLASPGPPLRVLLGEVGRRKLWAERQLGLVLLMLWRFSALCRQRVVATWRRLGILDGLNIGLLLTFRRSRRLMK